MRTIYHIELSSGVHKYYGSIAAMVADCHDIDVSASTLYKYDFTTPFGNSKCVIRRSTLGTAGQIKKNKMKKKLAFNKTKKAIASCKNKAQLATAYTMMGLFLAQFPDDTLNGELLQIYTNKFAELDIL